MRETASSSTAVPGDSAGVPGTNPSGRWQFSLDRGGTFTDVIGINPGGRLHTAKLLSDSPAYPNAAIEGIRRLLDLPPGAPVPEDRVGGGPYPMGTTVATNALLSGCGANMRKLLLAFFFVLFIWKKYFEKSARLNWWSSTNHPYLARFA